MASDPTGRDGEGFLTRWSRRKVETEPQDEADTGKVDGSDGAGASASDTEATGQTTSRTVADGDDQATSEQTDQDAVDTFADVDFDALDYNSDYTRFMGDNVPDDVRNQALAKLWGSDPILANVDGLTDYSEDFTDAALAVPMGALKTAYKVGQGFLTDEEAAEWDRLGREDDVDDPSSTATQPVMAAVTVGAESTMQDDIAAMFAASDAYSAALYPAESNHMVSAARLLADGAVFVVARNADGVAVGCGAILCQPQGDAEIKRMWVDPQQRRGGVGRKLLAALLEQARLRQVSVVRLETGKRQPEAVGLYKSAGFEPRGPFGSYVEDPNSVFMEHRLALVSEGKDEHDADDDGDLEL